MENEGRGWLALLLVGLLLGFGAGVATQRLIEEERYRGRQTEVMDENADGRADIWFVYQDGVLAESREDRDFDGRPDSWEEFDELGVGRRWSVDYDLDGTADAEVLQTDGRLRIGRYDTDFDSSWDLTCEFKLEMWEKCYWHPGGSAETERLVLYRNGYIREIRYAGPSAGTYNRVALFDEFERVLDSTLVDARLIDPVPQFR